VDFVGISVGQDIIREFGWSVAGFFIEFTRVLGLSEELLLLTKAVDECVDLIGCN